VNTAVLVLDQDLGFAFWLGRALDQEGFQAFPARSVSNAVELLSTLHLTVSLVIIKHSLPCAEHFIAKLRSSPPGVKVVMIAAPHERVLDVLGADLVWRQSEIRNESTKAELLYRLKELLGEFCSCDRRLTCTCMD
jgi:DNA-binding response OmpR family regulator